MVLWHQFLPDAIDGACEAALAQLRVAGIETKPYTEDLAGRPGVVFLRAVDARACEFIQRGSAAGRGRVLVVLLENAAHARDATWQLLRTGAADVLNWDPRVESATDLAARFARWDEVEQLLESSVIQKNLIGRSTTWISILRQIIEIARFTTASVLLTGASGTGKELAARLIHTLDPRPKKGELVILDCATVVPELSGSEFFGHERGSFTGAVAARDGAFALAHGGTLFLDEVGELPLALQAELLRVIQERTYKRVGSNTWHKTEFRLVCASNRDLQPEKSAGQFRSDLYYRIANWTCRLPCLSERREDILSLARHFIREFTSNGEPPGLDPPVANYLASRQYPGNVRELKQCVARMVYRHTGRGPLSPGDIPEEERPSGDAPAGVWHDLRFEDSIRRAVSMGATLRDIGRAAEETAVRFAVGEAGGNLQIAAQKLGVTDRALQLRRASQKRRSENGRARAATG